MKIGSLIVSVLELGIGFVLIYVSVHRRKNIPKNKNKMFWVVASIIGIVWGCIIVTASGSSILGYLFF